MPHISYLLQTITTPSAMHLKCLLPLLLCALTVSAQQSTLISNMQI
jgi:hypothetical protein